MTELTNIQILLLAAAAEREDGSLLPPPETLVVQRSAIRKALAALLGSGLAAEVAVAEDAKTWRRIGENRMGLVITEAGRAAVAPVVSGASAPKKRRSKQPAEPAPSPALADAPRSKSAEVLDMLGRGTGATLDEIVGATGWLPHSARAALTGLRKKGHVIEKSKRGEITCYRVSAR